MGKHCKGQRVQQYFQLSHIIFLFRQKFASFGHSVKLSESKWASQRVSRRLASTSITGATRSGPIRTTKRPILEPDGRPIPSEERLTPRESFLRRLASKPNSPTLLFASVSVFS